MTTTTEAHDLPDGEEVVTLQDGQAEGAKEDRGDEVTAAAPAHAAPDGDDQDQPGQRVPFSRFTEVNEQRKEAQRQLEQAQAEIERLRAGNAAAPARASAAATPATAPHAPEFDEDAKEAEYAEALLDGDTRKAATIRREINAHIRTSAAVEARSLGQAEAALADLDKVTTQALQDHPWLDTDEGAEALDMIVAVRDQKIARGMPASRALAEAVAAIAPRFAPETSAAPGKGSTAPAAALDTRTRHALARGATAANNQPPAIQAGLGNRTTAGSVDIENLTEEQFDALTPAEKKKYRGD